MYFLLSCTSPQLRILRKFSSVTRGVSFQCGLKKNFKKFKKCKKVVGPVSSFFSPSLTSASPNYIPKNDTYSMIWSSVGSCIFLASSLTSSSYSYSSTRAPTSKCCAFRLEKKQTIGCLVLLGAFVIIAKCNVSATLKVSLPEDCSFYQLYFIYYSH